MFGLSPIPEDWQEFLQNMEEEKCDNEARMALMQDQPRQMSLRLRIQRGDEAFDESDRESDETYTTPHNNSFPHAISMILRSIILIMMGGLMQMILLNG